VLFLKFWERVFVLLEERELSGVEGETGLFDGFEDFVFVACEGFTKGGFLFEGYLEVAELVEGAVWVDFVFLLADNVHRENVLIYII
jgi:hypothetical protein